MLTEERLAAIEKAARSWQLRREDTFALVAEVRRLRALLAETVSYLACYPCDDEEEGDDLADLERRVSAALAGEEG